MLCLLQIKSTDLETANSDCECPGMHNSTLIGVEAAGRQAIHICSSTLTRRNGRCLHLRWQEFVLAFDKPKLEAGLLLLYGHHSNCIYAQTRRPHRTLVRCSMLTYPLKSVPVEYKIRLVNTQLATAL